MVSLTFNIAPLGSLLSVLVTLLLSITPSAVANPNCTYLEIPLTATASNEKFPIPTGLNYSNPAAIDALVQTIIGDGFTVFPPFPTTFDGIIAARYCEPEVTVANRSDVVQLFMSGVTENNLYWFGLGYPTGFDGDMYSTVDYASKQGYPTLAIDRIGVGNSTHPDPVFQTQVPLEEAVSHQLVMMLKAGTAVPGKRPPPPKLRNIVKLSHSQAKHLTASSSSATPTAPSSAMPKPPTTPVISPPSSSPATVFLVSQSPLTSLKLSPSPPTFSLPASLVSRPATSPLPPCPAAAHIYGAALGPSIQLSSPWTSMTWTMLVLASFYLLKVD